MKLLNTRSVRLEEFDSERSPPYAILSHRWEEEEVTYRDILLGIAHERKGYGKLHACCSLARSRGQSYIWVDTCCIDKSSSAELTESINSMFRWYQGAEECYAYLSDVNTSHGAEFTPAEFGMSTWFSRGWTLQELIAPAIVIFFDHYWHELGSKLELSWLLSRITSIDQNVLAGGMLLSECPVAQRMAWAAGRTTTRVEDQAYSLLGIFDVYMPMLYGEGERAFQRLQEEIIKQSDDHTLFAWNDSRFAKSILAPSASCFSGLNDLIRIFPTNDTTQGFSLINTGLSIQLQLIPWSMNTYLAPLRCGYPSTMTGQHVFRGYDRACIFLQQTDHQNQFIRVSINGKDLAVLSGDGVADIRVMYGRPERHVLIRQLSPVSYVRPADVGFYGFTFSFEHASMFVTGKTPFANDVVCAHEWNSNKPLFKIEEGQHRSAGMFRLSGLSTGLYMYLGFSTDFEPLCLITTRSPRSRQFTVLESDFGTLEKADKLRLLDLRWLREQIEDSTASDDAILSLKGDRRSRVEVECTSLSLLLVLEWSKSNVTYMDGWQVSLKLLKRTDDHEMMPSEATPHPTSWQISHVLRRDLQNDDCIRVKRDAGLLPSHENSRNTKPVVRRRLQVSARTREQIKAIEAKRARRAYKTREQLVQATLRPTVLR